MLSKLQQEDNVLMDNTAIEKAFHPYFPTWFK